MTPKAKESEIEVPENKKEKREIVIPGETIGFDFSIDTGIR